MLKEERQRTILNTLHQDGKVLASELSVALGVSEDTIRRDLQELADAGKLQRVHGGGLPRSPAATASYRERLQFAPAAKALIALTALTFLENGQVILLDGGSTTLQVARQLPSTLRATLVTNNPAIAEALAEHPGCEIILIGGKYVKNSHVTVGAAAVDALRAIRADVYLMGACSLHPVAGITLPDYEEAQVKHAMVESAALVIALASAEKLDTAAPFVIAPIQALTHLVTEKNVSEQTLAPYREIGIQIVQG